MRTTRIFVGTERETILEEEKGRVTETPLNDERPLLLIENWTFNIMLGPNEADLLVTNGIPAFYRKALKGASK
jgi:hypothetical protein